MASTSPYGIVGPKGMDPAVVKALHGAYDKAMGDPEHLERLEQLNKAMGCRSGEEGRKQAVETYVKDKD